MTVSLLLALTLAAPSAPAAGPPKLGVVVVIDQFGAADLETLALLGHRDFGGLSSRGAAHFDAWYAALTTETGPGHATIATGAAPATHGVCANDWYSDGKRTYCVDDAAPVLGAPSLPGRGPRALQVPTLGDTLRTRSPGSRVVSVSVKDRSAILMGGAAANVALWYEAALGRFTSSGAYVSQLPAWAEPLASLPQRAFAEGEWSPLPNGTARAVPDDRPGESTPEGFTTHFPHDLKSLPDAKKGKAYRYTPSAMEAIFALATAAVDGEQLGRRAAPDLLWVSVSTTDYAGHAWGPGSAEKLDMLERTSAELQRFMKRLDEKLGAGNWVLAVTGDHGGAPLPEQAASQKVPSGRLLGEELVKAARSELDATRAARVLDVDAPNVFLDERGLASSDAEKLRAQVASGLSKLRGVQLRDRADPLVASSIFPGRCGPMLFSLAPNFVFGEEFPTGVEHASGNTYDRRVPLFFVGRGVRGGRYATPVDPRDVAASIALALGIPPPDRSEGLPVQRHFPQPLSTP